MSLFEEHIEALEIAAKALAWMGFIAVVVLLFAGHVSVPMAVAAGAVLVSRVILYEFREIRACRDRESAGEAELRREQRREHRERELRLQILRLQRPER
ncbi:hypothetical protein ACIBCT_09565 [Streptosporangium sp. NPDC050855]|uniref:hypothetical protein n=1 Tax=Streptosporangium sp. NPDC050855 TaxID=3366194 RepID=UPI00379892B8